MEKKEISLSLPIDEYNEIKAYAEACERTIPNLLKYACKTHRKRYPIVGVNDPKR
jgi:hypothetical protein